MKREPGSPSRQAATAGQSTPRTLRKDRASRILLKTSRGEDRRKKDQETNVFLSGCGHRGGVLVSPSGHCGKSPHPNESWERAEETGSTESLWLQTSCA
ncbi:unnamed protein product [Pleuronectes platessa]|uniref:Uncharacterized protein n=1 Tax=Pleuronectes platessa TaxID=8262 RepID=A0A9N7Z3E4_PLEPL|nr:unnamed protein product [Pleuronectes platessa]